MIQRAGKALSATPPMHPEERIKDNQVTPVSQWRRNTGQRNGLLVPAGVAIVLDDQSLPGAHGCLLDDGAHREALPKTPRP
jgi:hypothetical protein